MKSTLIQIQIYRKETRNAKDFDRILSIAWSFCPRCACKFRNRPDSVEAVATNGAQFSHPRPAVVFRKRLGFKMGIDVSCQLAKFHSKSWLDLINIFVEIVFLLPLVINFLHSLLLSLRRSLSLCLQKQPRFQQPTRIQQLRFNNQNAGFNNQGFSNQNSRIQQPKKL